MKQIILILCYIFIIIDFSIGQISQGGIPYSFQSCKNRNEANIVFLEKIPIMEMKSIDKSVIDELIKNNNKEAKSYQFAYGFDVVINVKENAIVDSLECGFLYRLAIKSKDAYSINIIFSEYSVPPGAKLFLYNKTKDCVLGAYTSNNNKESKVLPVSPVAGDEIIIEYFEPYFADFKGTLIIEKVSHDFLNVLNIGEEKESKAAGNCQVDINCSPEGDDWQKEKRSVCRILINGTGLCSGALINNTNNDGTPYFLTAHHCISTQKEAKSAIFYFNYERSVCNSGSGSLSQSISGATLRATSNGSDFTLLELSKTPLSTFRPYFAGWDRNTVQNASGVGIHHPNGDPKEISIYNNTPIQGINSPQDVNYSSACWKVTWSSGLVKKGSSGSPLFNSNKKIIGQAFSTSNYCHNTLGPVDPTFYGRFDVSWTGNNTAATRLVTWLNPNNDRVILDGIEGCYEGTKINIYLSNTVPSGSDFNYLATNKIESSSIIQNNAIVRYKAGNILLKEGFHAQQGSQFEAKAANYDCVVTCDPINLVYWTNYACRGQGLNYIITNASLYSVKIHTTAGALVYSGSGAITNNNVSVWNALVPFGYYTATVTFYTDCEEISNSYRIFVNACANKSVSNDNEIDSTFIETDINLTMEENLTDKFNFNVHPNPTNGNFTLELETGDIVPYTVEIFNSMGSLIYKIEYCNAYQLNMDCSHLSKGAYFIRLSMGINSVVKKVIIQ